MSKNWKTTAVVWINDDVLRNVVAGMYGFVFWETDGIVFAPFNGRREAVMSSFLNYTSWEDIRKFDNNTPKTAIMRFVRTGLFPSH